LHSKQYILDCGGSVLSPILGITASQNYPRITGSYESISTVTLGGSQASITFSSIPSTYQHLQIRGVVRSDRGVTIEGLSIRFNSDTGLNYAYHGIQGTGSSAASFAGWDNDQSLSSLAASANAGSSIFGAGVIDILDYANTNKYTTIRTLTGVNNNDASNGRAALFSGLWRNTAAITSFTIFSGASTNLSQYSSFALYGIKG
jgi:hypothetical protein